MNDITQSTIGSFLDELASSSPAPGGGTTAALSGAIGAALVSMLCNLTIGRPKFSEYDSFARETLIKSEALRQTLTRCADEDMIAYNGVIAALRLPKASDDEKAIRSQRLQEAYKSATSAPASTITNCLEVMRLARALIGHSNPSAECDLAAAAIQANSGIAIALDSIKANLSLIKDTDYAARTSRFAEEAVTEARTILQEIEEAVRK